MKNIIQIITSPNWGGAQRVAFEVAEYSKKKFIVQFIAGNEGNRLLFDVLDKHNIKYSIWNCIKRKVLPIEDIMFFLKLLIFLIKNKPCVIHCHSSKSGVIGRLAGYLSGNKTIFTVHGWSFYSLSKEKYNYGVSLERILSRVPCKIICVSESDYNYAKDSKFHMPNIKTILNGVSTKKNVVSERSDIVFVGRLSNQKYPELFIKIAQELIKSGIKSKFVLFGEGDLFNKCAELSKGNTRIVFKGHVNNEEEIYRNACLLVNTSRYEGLPLTILEAMSYGIPVIASNIKGNNEIIINGVDGYLIDGGKMSFVKKINYLLNNRSKYEFMSKNAKCKIEKKYSIDRMCHEYLMLFK